MRLITIAGSRKFTDRDKMKAVIRARQKLFDNIILCSGGAEGADTLAREIAEELGIKFVELSVEISERVGTAAYVRAHYARNTSMAEFGDELHCFYVTEFPDGGTKNTDLKAHRMSKPVYRYYPSGRVEIAGTNVKKITDF